ncbi:MAG: hypothetical protein ACRDGV_09800 [Candidatus Limnocylindria bacterium]
MNLLRAATLLVVLTLTSVACVADNRPDPQACGQASVALDLRLAEGTLEPNDPAVCRGQEVTLTIDVEQDGVFHIHGYDEEVSATEVRAGEATTFEFRASRSGQFPIELHTDDEPEGVPLGIFTVHEP